MFLPAFKEVCARLVDECEQEVCYQSPYEALKALTLFGPLLTMDPPKIAINAQLESNSGGGGAESVLIALVAALGRLDDGDERYVIIGPHSNPGWLRPYLGSNQRITAGPAPIVTSPTIAEHAKRALGPLRPLIRGLWRTLVPPKADRSTNSNPERSVPIWRPSVARSNGFYEGLGCDVIHFPYQDFAICRLPMIYNPHDLQHRHYPEFFTAGQRAWRDEIYRTGCELARTVVTASQWVKDDVMSEYAVDPRKIQVIPCAPPTQAYRVTTSEKLSWVKAKYHLKEPFSYFPAMTWQHKNHIRLLEALALLRDRAGLRVNLVCTGNQNEFWPKIEQRIAELNLGSQVRFLGMVPPDEVPAIYRAAQFVVVPTLFEAASGPVFEAWQEGTPVACSTVTSLPEQVGDAALLFDPLSTEAIADAVARLSTDTTLREDLKARGRRRLQDFSWERTAKAYRAVYRRAANRHLTEEDHWLLSWDWMREPKRAKELLLS